MLTTDTTRTLARLFSELVDGANDPGGAFMLNSGDVGLLRSLDRLSPAAASHAVDGGATIAAHAQHVRYGLSLMNRWAAGEKNPWQGADWTVSWRTTRVTDDEWKRLRAELRKETTKWTEAAGKPRELSDLELNGVVGNIAHLAYHLGAIRQIGRAARGPTAEEEARLQSS